jgi:hypothetical protein
MVAWRSGDGELVLAFYPSFPLFSFRTLVLFISFSTSPEKEIGGEGVGQGVGQCIMCCPTLVKVLATA